MSKWERTIKRKQRKRVLKRDNNRCVVCWREYQLTIHHHHDFTGAIPSRKEDWAYNNPYVLPRDCDLVTLCKACHGKIGACEKRSPLYLLVTNYLADSAKQDVGVLGAT